ncbi:hypothetical protein PInf_026804 [Phytophthora infestans]|nr:hypothetical protein PInf_026804 [Phytophthora infestans]
MTDLQDVKVNGEGLLPDSGRKWSPDVLLELCYMLGIWGVLLLRCTIKATILRGSTASVTTDCVVPCESEIRLHWMESGQAAAYLQ